MSEEIRGVRTARKIHRCDGERSGCPGAIQVGQLYLYSALPPNSDLGNERWWTAKICASCVAASGRSLDTLGGAA